MHRTGDRPLKVLHVFRAPIGGLFRHVVDLVRGQIARGHQVGIIADSTTGDARAAQTLAKLEPDLALGVRRLPMSRHVGGSDFAAVWQVGRRLNDCGADVIHGHGAKGGAYARLMPTGRVIRVYTPHGGSLNYDRRTAAGLFYLGVEQVLMRRTELFLFESAYAREAFRRKIGSPAGIVRVVHNGVAADEFQPVEPVPSATDVVFVGELRSAKGINVLIEAVAILARSGRRLSATIVGSGPEAAALATMAEERGVTDLVRFVSPMPARLAFGHGRVLVVPSLQESLPYVVLEAAAAGLPLVATAVGGIPEIYGSQATRLITPNDATALARSMAAALADPAAEIAAAKILQARVRDGFSVDAMTDQVIAAYRESLHPGDGL